MWTCSQVNATGPHLLGVDIDISNDFVSSGNMPLPEPIYIYPDLHRHIASLGHNCLTVFCFRFILNAQVFFFEIFCTKADSSLNLVALNKTKRNEDFFGFNPAFRIQMSLNVLKVKKIIGILNDIHLLA